MYCTNCGKELTEGTMYCPNCGAKVGGESIGPTTPDMTTTQQTTTKKESLFSKLITVYRSWVWVLLIGSVFVYFFVLPKKDDAGDTDKLQFTQIQASETGYGNVNITMSLINNLDTPVKSVDYLVMAWDEDKLPVTVADNYVYSAHPYYQYLTEEGVNIPAGGTHQVDISIWNDIDSLHYIKPMVVGYTTYDGKTWEHSNLDALMDHLAGNPLKRPDVFEMTPSTGVR